jgi:hypothetical protein
MHVLQGLFCIVDIRLEQLSRMCRERVSAVIRKDQIQSRFERQQGRATTVRVDQFETDHRHRFEGMNISRLLLPAPHDLTVTRARRRAVRAERINGNDHIRHQKAVLGPCAPKHM